MPRNRPTYIEKITALTEKGVIPRLLDKKFLFSPVSEKPEEQINFDDYANGYITALYVLITVRQYSIEDALRWLSALKVHWQAETLAEIFIKDRQMQFHPTEVIAEINDITEIHELGAFERLYIFGLRKSDLLSWKEKTKSKWEIDHTLALEMLMNSFFCDLSSAMNYLLELSTCFQARAFYRIVQDNLQITLEENGHSAIIQELQELTWAQCTAMAQLYRFGLRKEHFNFWNARHPKEKFNEDHHVNLLFFLILEKKIDPQSAVILLSQHSEFHQAAALLTLLKLGVQLDEAIKELESLEELENAYFLIEGFYEYGIRKQHLFELKSRTNKNFSPFHVKPLGFFLATKKCDVKTTINYLCKIFDFHQSSAFLRMMKKDTTLSIEILLDELEGLSERECCALEDLYTFGLRKRHFLSLRELRPNELFSHRGHEFLREKLIQKQDQPVDQLINDLIKNRSILKKGSGFFVVADQEVKMKDCDLEKKRSLSL